ncbi:MAG: methyl-accepting chemotaxis protein [Bacillota bacterium]|jgi:methyl-accepting chemotaxis protein|nr:methyl-accepting chemotaxis protein [Bacillota bacterium]
MRKVKIIKQGKGFISIKRKLMTALFCASLVLLTLTGIIIGITVNNNSNKDQKEILNQTSNAISNKSELFFQRYITIVEQMAQDKNMQNLLVDVKDREHILTSENYNIVRETLIDTQKSNKDVILSAYIAEADPSYYVDDLSGVSDESFDLKTRDYYVTIKEGVVNITEPYVDVATGNMVITITAPVYVNGNIEGLTGVDIEITALSKVVGETKLGNEGYFYLLTENNIIVSHKDDQNILKSIKEIGISSNLISLIENNINEVTEYSYNDEIYIGNLVNIADTNWKIVSALPKMEFSENTRNVRNIIILIYILTIAILVILMNIIVGIVTKPIKKITVVTNKLALGELDSEIDISSNDEIGELAKSIESLTKRLNSYIIYINESVSVLDGFAQGNLNMNLVNDYEGEFNKLKNSLISVSGAFKNIIGKIKISSETINVNSEQVSNGAQTLARGTTEQASAIEELSAEMNEIYSTILNNAQNADNAGKKAIESANEVEKGNVIMTEMLKAMDEISNSSKEIGKIIKVIDDIAFQTNILALNAAVEAARAGSAGKGFAVVADEVRNLAGKSAEAAKQTTTLIENSILAINKGTDLAKETGMSLKKIVEKTKETSFLIEEIASASSHQTASVNQIKDGIEQIASVTQENASTAESSAANSEELSGQSQVLNELVSKFKINN